VDTSQILSIFIKGALGSRGRKSARRAARFLDGNSGFLAASAIFGAAGVAWGVYDTMQQNAASSSAPPPSPALTTPPPVPAAARPMTSSTAAAVSNDDRDMPLEVLRIVRLAVSAARADGVLLPAERALILSHARAAGLESVVEVELSAPRPLSEIAGGIADDRSRRDLYVLAFTIVRADEHVSGAERVYLAQLAHQLGLDSATVASLEADTASKIDATPDTNP